MSKSTTGHCYCGSVQFEVSGDPIWVSHCHCESCRRHTGSVIATFAGYHPDQLKLSGSLPSVHVSDKGVRRSFCGDCGSPFSYEFDRWPDQVHLYLGLFDDPQKIQPSDHVFYAERIPWLNVDDQLPHYDGSGDD